MRKRTGSIDVTADGRHRVRVSLPGGERPTIGIFDDAADAECVKRATIQQLDSTYASGGVTLREWGEKWLTERELSKAVSDPRSDWTRWNHHIKTDPIAKMPIGAIRRRHVKNWLGRVRKVQAHQSTLNALWVVRGALMAAYERGLVKTNPAVELAKIRVKKDRRTEEVWTYATPDEQAAIVRATPGAEKWIVAFAIGSGLRAGELVSLRLADVHLEGEQPHVAVRYGGPPAKPTKGGRVREVPLFGVSLFAMREWLRELPAFVRENPKALAFPRMGGNFRDRNHVIKWETWKAILEAAKITRDFRWHDLRHTCGSALISGWWGRAWSLAEICDLLGHESITTTERYAHLAPTAMKQAAAATMGLAAIGQQLATIPPAPLANSPMITDRAALGNRTPDLRFTNSQLNEEISRAYATNGQIVAICACYLQAVARGDVESADAYAAQLGAELTRDRTRTTELAEAIIRAAMPAAKREVGS